MTLYLLVVNLPPQLEEDLVDYLLAQEELGGFTSFAVNGHGDKQKMGIAEQVSGRQKRRQFEMIVSESLADKILAGLKTEVGRDIIYWQHPLSDFGRID